MEKLFMKIKIIILLMKIQSLDLYY